MPPDWGTISSELYQKIPQQSSAAGNMLVIQRQNRAVRSNPNSHSYLLCGYTTEDLCALYRYDMAAGVTELCCSIPYFAYYPHLSETADGSLIILEDNALVEANLSIVEIRYENEQWTVTRHPFSQPMKYWYVNRLNYAGNSDQALMTGRIALQVYLAFMKVRPGDDFDGLNEYYAIDRETNQVVALDYDALTELLPGMMDAESKEIRSELLPYHEIQKMVLSPDGCYALVLTRNGEEAHLFMLRLETLECREVGGLEAQHIDTGSLYPPVIEWNGEKLIMCTEDGIGLFEFE